MEENLAELKTATRHTSYFLVLVVLLFNASFQLGAGEKTIRNPIAPHGQDPWIVQHEGTYLYCYSHRGSIYVNQHATIKTACQRQGTKIWTPPPGKPHSKELWAPELHSVGSRWYVYFAADDGKNQNHRMYVLESETANPLGAYRFAGKIAAQTDKWAIDGTILKLGEQLYFIWSGWEGDVNVQQNLYIAKMEGPKSISGERVEISRPTYDWEKIGRPLINEGPQVLKHGKQVFVVYSASGSWTDDYCLGLLTLQGNDPMDPKSWLKTSTPVFGKTGTVFGPGHASFVKSPDQKEDWIIYHTAKHKGSGWKRDINAKRFTWTIDGKPCFGYPESKDIVIPAPSGE